jgi:hypothetical protein
MRRVALIANMKPAPALTARAWETARAPIALSVYQSRSIPSLGILCKVLFARRGRADGLARNRSQCYKITPLFEEEWSVGAGVHLRYSGETLSGRMVGRLSIISGDH